MDLFTIAAIIAFVVLALSVWAYMAIKNSAATAHQHFLEAQARARAEAWESKHQGRHDLTQKYIANNYPEEYIRKRQQEWRFKDKAEKPPIGETFTFAAAEVIVVYQIADSAKRQFVEQQFADILKADPNADLEQYEAILSVRIMDEQRKPLPPKPPEPERKVIKGFDF